MRIPEQFKLAGCTIKVEMLDNLVTESGGLGLCCYNTNTIKLQGSGIPREALEQTFCHELVHMVLHYMSDEKSTDEKFVDLMGHFLHQALNTQKGSYVSNPD